MSLPEDVTLSASDSKTSQMTSSSIYAVNSAFYNSLTSRSFTIPSEENMPTSTLTWIRPKRWTTEDYDLSAFSCFTQDIMLKIFSYFTEKELCSSLSHVCRKWYTLSRDPMFWKTLTFSGGKAPVNYIRKRFRECPQVRTVRLTCVPYVIVILRQMCRSVENLQSLTLKFCTATGRVDEGYPQAIPESVMLNVLYTFPRLEYLSLKGTQVYSRKFYQQVANLSNLRSLNLGHSLLIQPQDLTSIIVNLKFLQELRLIPRCTLQGRPVLMDDDCVLMFSILKDTLLKLRFDAEGLGDRTFESIFNCQKLRFLDIENATLLSSDYLPLIAKLKDLRHFRITNTYNLSSKAFVRLFTLNDIKRLQHLSLGTCCNLDDTALEAIAKTCVELRHLNVQSCKSVTDEGIEHVIQRCHNLESLNVSYLFRLEGSCFKLIPKCLPSLKTLAIEAGTSNEKKEALQLLKRRCPKLHIREMVSEFGTNLLPVVS